MVDLKAHRWGQTQAAQLVELMVQMKGNLLAASMDTAAVAQRVLLMVMTMADMTVSMMAPSTDRRLAAMMD